MKHGLIVWIGLLASMLSCQDKPDTLNCVKKEGKLSILNGNQVLLSYQYDILYPPNGVDSSFRRSGFIHPINTPNDQSLTQIQPEDHFHHYGLWNPWTHVLFEGDTVDFWNLGKKEGTVRFAGYKTIENGSAFCSFQVLHEHVLLTDGIEKVVLNELQTIQVHGVSENQYTIDLTIQYSCATDSPFEILEYRYGGLGWRATEKWTDANSQILTSEGKTRVDADGSLARWILAEGELEDGSGGMLILSHPDNYNHPEPVRVWPIDENQRSVFICYSPTKNQDWLLEPNKTYQLKYQLVVYNFTLSAETANGLWNQFVESSLE